MTTNAKDSWFATRLPCMGALCSTYFQKNRAPEAPYFEVFPFLIAVTAAFLSLSGIVLAVYYNPWHAFDSLQFIDRNVNNGWLIRAYHATGTTMIFGLAYLYLFRSMLVRSYRAPGEFAWMLTVKLIAILLLTGWFGYVMTGGAAGHWSLFNAANTALTLGGGPGAIGRWVFGGPAGGGTLARLAVFHVLLALSALLVVWLIMVSRRNTAAQALTQTPARLVAFYPYYLAQYFAALAVFAFVFAIFAFYAPGVGAGQLNTLPAGALAVPLGAALPWYLTPAAGIIAVFPTAVASIAGAVAAIVLLYALPWLDRSGPNGRRGRLYAGFTWLLGLDVLALGVTVASACPVSPLLEAVFTAWYFFHFLVITPVVTAMEAE